jgi:membrane protein
MTNPRAIAGATGRRLKNNVVIRDLVTLVVSLYRSLVSLWRHQAPTRAGALTYTTMLAVVPFLIVLSSVAAELGYLPLLSSVLPELRETFGVQVPLDKFEEIIERAQGVPLGRLGILGGVSFLATFLLAVSNLEQAINAIWGIKRGRNWLVRLRDYVPFLLFLVLFSFLIAWILVELKSYLNVIALGSSEHEMDQNFPLRTIVGFTMGLSWFAIGVLYYLIPHSRVRVRSAAIGATFSTALLFGFFYLMLRLQTLLFARYSLLYGSLAGFPLLMILLYVSWVIILFGAALTHCYHTENK